MGLHSFEGNKAETKTLLPVIEAFQAQHKLSNVTIVADAAMLSATNLEALTKAGYTFIVGSLDFIKFLMLLPNIRRDGELRSADCYNASG